jgi:hypothetical protein
MTERKVSSERVYRHKKRGTEYVLIGIGKMQADGWVSSPKGIAPVDMREVAVYRSVTDPTEIWARPREEFEDGRFEALPTAAPAVSSERVSEERLGSFIKRCEDMSEGGKFLWWTELASILRDYAALRSSVKTVGVKALEWVQVRPDYFEARTPFGIFSVVGQLCFGKPWRTFTPIGWQGFTGDSADELKERLERSYERRILSAIEAPAAASEVTDEMVQKAWEAYDAKSGYSKPERFRAALTAALKGDRP